MNPQKNWERSFLAMNIFEDIENATIYSSMNHLYDSKLMNPRIDEKEPEKTEVINYATDIEHRIPGWLKEPNGSSRLTTLNKNLNDVHGFTDKLDEHDKKDIDSLENTLKHSELENHKFSTAYFPAVLGGLSLATYTEEVNIIPLPEYPVGWLLPPKHEKTLFRVKGLLGKKMGMLPHSEQDGTNEIFLEKDKAFKIISPNPMTMMVNGETKKVIDVEIVDKNEGEKLLNEAKQKSVTDAETYYKDVHADFFSTNPFISLLDVVGIGGKYAQIFLSKLKNILFSFFPTQVYTFVDFPDKVNPDIVGLAEGTKPGSDEKNDPRLIPKILWSDGFTQANQSRDGSIFSYTNVPPNKWNPLSVQEVQIHPDIRYNRETKQVTIYATHAEKEIDIANKQKIAFAAILNETTLMHAYCYKKGLKEIPVNTRVSTLSQFQELFRDEKEKVESAGIITFKDADEFFYYVFSHMYSSNKEEQLTIQKIMPNTYMFLLDLVIISNMHVDDESPTPVQEQCLNHINQNLNEVSKPLAELAQQSSNDMYQSTINPFEEEQNNFELTGNPITPFAQGLQADLKKAEKNAPVLGHPVTVNITVPKGKTVEEVITQLVGTTQYSFGTESVAGYNPEKDLIVIQDIGKKGPNDRDITFLTQLFPKRIPITSFMKEVDETKERVISITVPSGGKIIKLNKDALIATGDNLDIKYSTTKATGTATTKELYKTFMKNKKQAQYELQNKLESYNQGAARLGAKIQIDSLIPDSDINARRAIIDCMEGIESNLYNHPCREIFNQVLTKPLFLGNDRIIGDPPILVTSARIDHSPETPADLRKTTPEPFKALFGKYKLTSQERHYFVLQRIRDTYLPAGAAKRDFTDDLIFALSNASYTYFKNAAMNDFKVNLDVMLKAFENDIALQENLGISTLDPRFKVDPELRFALVFAYAYSMNKDKRTKIYSAYPNEIKFLESLTSHILKNNAFYPNQSINRVFP